MTAWPGPSADATVGVLCRRADAHGSIVANPRLPRAGARPGRVCASTECVYRSLRVMRDSGP